MFSQDLHTEYLWSLQEHQETAHDCGVQFECIDVDKLDGDAQSSILEEVKKLNPDCSFPTIVIGDKIIVGYREKEIKEALNQ